MKKLNFFATCPRGLEASLAQELSDCGAAEVQQVSGGVAFSGDMSACYRANLESRLATRVLMRVAHAAYRNEQDVYEQASAVPWTDWFSERESIRVDINASRCPLKSLDFVTLRIKDAVCDRFRSERGQRPDVDTRSPDVRIHAYLDAHFLTLYIDTSGEPLYKRGYRREASEAPLKENLAAGIIALTGWDRSEPLVDPMCGSGTLLIEAALMALRIPPGHARGFGFERLASFDEKAWRTVREAALARSEPPRPLPIFGRDRYGDELKRAEQNLEAAGLAGCVELKQADVLETRPPAPAGVMVTNPPYGVRLGEDAELAEFYPKLGDALKRNYPGWRCYLFSGDTRLAKLIRLTPSRKTPLYNGAIECRLYEYRMVAGSMRKDRAPDANTPS
jgi:putative N6-adenine-specific DNA methylase